ncbi:hypothetical protein SprV_0802642600 [Sparganum proliferum]
MCNDAFGIGEEVGLAGARVVHSAGVRPSSYKLPPQAGPWMRIGRKEEEEEEEEEEESLQGLLLLILHLLYIFHAERSLT